MIVQNQRRPLYRFIFTLLFLFLTTLLKSQSVSNTFELRYLTNDLKANGETDFKGETEWFNNSQRVDFLNKYAQFASGFFNNPGLDKKIVTEVEVDSLLKNIKAQPATSIRQTINLDKWRAYGYKEGQDIEKEQALNNWEKFDGATIKNGSLIFEDTKIVRSIDSLTWRFKFNATLKTVDGGSCMIKLLENKKEAISIGIEKDYLVFGTGKELKKVKSHTLKDGVKLSIEADLSQKKFNLYMNGNRIQYYIPMVDTTINRINYFSVSSKGITSIDNLLILNHTITEAIRYPYKSNVVLNEDFEPKNPVDRWEDADFDDSSWKEVTLPSVHGGILEKEEYYYLRKKLTVGEFERAILRIESLDPGGEIWINGKVAEVVKNRHPVILDVGKYLLQNKENTIAIKVNPYKLNNPMPHTPTDYHIGWFLGRAKLELSNNHKITDLFVYTKQIEKEAIQLHKVNVQFEGHDYFDGSIEINYYPWFPEEGNKVASVTKKVSIPPRITNEYLLECTIPSLGLWNCLDPKLYKVETILYDKNGRAVDDFVTTTGIRTVEQKNGAFYVNGKPEMLNGAQIMGFRIPIETIAKNNRCAPWETVAEEMLMIKKMDANLLRMHVHAEKDTTDGINDPRYAEFADQMGIMLIWQTAGFIREGEAWNVDFDGYPKFMKQVFNHPSIVIWEASNHPNKFKEHNIAATQDFVRNIYHTIHSIDSSRLISPTTFWKHTHYGNYLGTIDYQGNVIKPVPEYMAKLVTRGGQDAYSGYGREWTAIRNAPNDWAASCLESIEKAYFNFEHEESIGQPNWDLCKGKPWYLLQSYEWTYDEGSIGRKLTAEEWKASQAWQAFAAWESMKKQILLGYDGFSWCCLHGGANMGTYKKPLIDNLGHPKLAYYTNKMIFQKTWAGSNNVDVVYGPEDNIKPVIYHLGETEKADLVIQMKSVEGDVIDNKVFKNIILEEGQTITKLKEFKFKNIVEGAYAICYQVIIK